MRTLDIVRRANVVLNRKVMQKLIGWQERRRGTCAVLPEGARHVGKTTLVKAFGEGRYDSFLLVDFSELPVTVRQIFEDHADDLDTFFMILATYYGTRLHRRHSLIVFDEVQLYPKARQMIKRLVVDGRYDYIETGSLVSSQKNVEGILIPSEEHPIALEPLDFEEFLWAMGEDLLAEVIADAFSTLRPLPDFLHKRAMRLWREYLMVGCMPQAVVECLKTRDLYVVDKVKRNILALYRNDIDTYADGHARVRAIFDAMSNQLAKRSKKFILAAIDAHARGREYGPAFWWLEDARMANLCLRCTDPDVGLESLDVFGPLKCYMADTELLVTQAFKDRKTTSDDVYRSILFDRLSLRTRSHSS